jgi:hypothetical protein
MSDEGIKSTWRCPACGRENPATASRCSLCLAARPGAADIVAEPSPVRGPSAETDEDNPRPPPSAPARSSVRWLTGAFIVGACGLLIPVFGSGLALLVALVPALIRLFRADCQPTANPLVRPADQIDWGWGSVAAAIAAASLVFISSLITFMIVFTLCTRGAIYDSTGRRDHSAELLDWVGGVTMGVLAAGGVGYGLVRLMFRREKRRDKPWEPPSSSFRP